MDIKIGEEIVGRIYMNIQFPLEYFEGKSFSQVLERVKGSESVEKQIFELGDIGKFTVATFRRIYNDDSKLCIEGAELEKA